jgi:2-(1,2-epoxy-1,2-dihydrophenyl)acetyl-CoA isomerase
MSVDLLVERRDAVAVLTLNRPQKMNALVGRHADELRDSLLAAEADPEVRAAVLTGAGRGFCAGADLSEADPDARRVLRDHFNPLIATMRESKLPIVAVVNGVAAGAGASIALAADLRVLAPSARFVFAFTRAGLIPDAGATWLLPRIVGAGRAFEIAAFGAPIEAERALVLGLANQVTDDDASALEAGLGAAATLAAGPYALGLTKQALATASESGLTEQLRLESELQGEAARSEDCAEALAAFGERREPHFKGR